MSLKIRDVDNLEKISVHIIHYDDEQEFLEDAQDYLLAHFDIRNTQYTVKYIPVSSIDVMSTSIQFALDNSIPPVVIYDMREGSDDYSGLDQLIERYSDLRTSSIEPIVLSGFLDRAAPSTEGLELEKYLRQMGIPGKHLVKKLEGVRKLAEVVENYLDNYFDNVIYPSGDIHNSIVGHSLEATAVDIHIWFDGKTLKEQPFLVRHGERYSLVIRVVSGKQVVELDTPKNQRALRVSMLCEHAIPEFHTHLFKLGNPGNYTEKEYRLEIVSREAPKSGQIKIAVYYNSHLLTVKYIDLIV